jgi:hypothetical protein
MNLRPAVDAQSAAETALAQLDEHTRAAKRLMSTDPLMALAQLSEIENDLLEPAMEHAVAEARRAGATWAEIAAATSVKDRQAAWRRWAGRGIR